MDLKNIKDYFYEIIEQHPELSVAVVAIKTLMKVIKEYKCETLQELDENLKSAILVMKDTNYSVAAITSGCELFIRFITLARLDTNTFEECKEIMLNRGNVFLQKLNQAKSKIVKLATKFIVDGCTILTHSKSRVVLYALTQAATEGKKFQVFVTCSAPDNSGQIMIKNLETIGIQCIIILDAAIGYIMEQIDFVMVGAEAVVESGGIVNKVGSYTMAICAKEMNKPFYVLTESFKFSRLYPLNQQDLPKDYKYTPSSRKTGDVKKLHPIVDYTPPSYITLLFTDLGILTPSAVSDELIKLYL